MTRIVVMGGGLIGRRHVERVQAHPHATLVGLVDPDPDAAADLDVPRFPSLGAATAADGVIIATPTPLHADHALDAEAAGLPMLIEKPVAQTLSQADRLTGLQQPVLIGHHRRHHPAAQVLCTKLPEIGTPITATLIWAMKKPDAYFQDNWRSADGSPVMINLVHDLDLLAYWFGPITDIHAVGGPIVRSNTRVEAGAIALRHASGTATTISFADTALSPWGFEAGTGENPNIGTTGQDMLWITGTKGALSFPSLTLWRGTDWSTPAEAQAPAPLTDAMTGPAPLDAQLDHFLDVIAGRSAPLCTLADGRAALAAALEIETQLSRRAA